MWGNQYIGMALYYTRKLKKEGRLPLSGLKRLVIPKAIQKELDELVLDFQMAGERANKILEMGRKAGFSDLEIGKWMKQALDKAGYSRMQASRLLPETAKYKPRGDPHGQGHGNVSGISNKMLQTKPVVQSTENVVLLPQRPGRVNQGPEEYKIEELDQYDIEYLKEIIKWQHDKIETLQSKPKPKSGGEGGPTTPRLKPYEPPTGKLALDSWSVAHWMDDKMEHCRLCQEIGEVDPNRKQVRDRMFEHEYKHYGKHTGFLQETVLVDDVGRVDVYHISFGAHDGLGHLFGDGKSPSEEYLARELQPRKKYWSTHMAPMDKIEQAKREEVERERAYKKYQEERSKLLPEEKKALEEYESDILFSGLRSAMKK